MSSIGRKEGIVAGEEEPYVTAAAAAVVVVPPGWVGWLRVLLVAVEGEVYGRVNSSKRSASRGWCMWMWVAEESLLWWWGSQ